MSVHKAVGNKKTATATIVTPVVVETQKPLLASYEYHTPVQATSKHHVHKHPRITYYVTYLRGGEYGRIYAGLKRFYGENHKEQMKEYLSVRPGYYAIQRYY